MLNMTPSMCGIPKRTQRLLLGSNTLSSLLFPICLLCGLMQAAHNTDTFCVLLLLILVTGSMHKKKPQLIKYLEHCFISEKPPEFFVIKLHWTQHWI